MSGRKVLVVLLGTLLVAVGFIFYFGATGGGTGDARHRPGPFEPPGPAEPPPSLSISAAPTGALADAGPLAKTVSDRRLRDEMRRRILAAWMSEGDDDTRKAAQAGRFVARPNADGRGIEASYIEDVTKNEFIPMARRCYEELLVRSPDAGGRLAIEFTIAGDDAVGGLVEDAKIAESSTLSDEKIETCMRETLLTLAFPPPAHDGVVTVTFPITLAPGDAPND
jgi:hypothetical protein